MELQDYLKDHTSAPDEVLRWLIKETNIRTNHARMLSGEVLGKLLEFISKMISPSRILEIGTFTGYSAICLASGLKEGGSLHAIELNDEQSALISEAFERAGISQKSSVFYGDAKIIIPSLKDIYDLVYIDANKREYSLYYDLVFDKVAAGGYIIADNVLWDGKVLQDPLPADAQTKSLAEFNEKIKNDRRVEKVMLPLRDGLFIIRKIE